MARKTPLTIVKAETNVPLLSLETEGGRLVKATEAKIATTAPRGCVLELASRLRRPERP